MSVVESLVLSTSASAAEWPVVIVDVECLYAELAIIGLVFEEEGLSTHLSVRLVRRRKSRKRNLLHYHVPYSSAAEAD